MEEEIGRSRALANQGKHSDRDAHSKFKVGQTGRNPFWWIPAESIVGESLSVAYRQKFLTAEKNKSQR